MRCRWLVAGGAFALAACGDNKADGGERSADDATFTGKGIYAFTRTVAAPDDSETAYVTLTRSMDVKADSLAEGRELKGQVRALSGHVVSASTDAPELTQHKVDDELGWHDGETLSFARFPLPEGPNFYFMFQADEHHMYMPYDGHKRIVWDPLDMKIVKSFDSSELEAEIDGLQLRAAGNKTRVSFDGRDTVLMPYFHAIESDWYRSLQSSYIAVIDKKTHEEKAVVEVPCPALGTVTTDEDGYVYLSSNEAPYVLALFDQGPKPCIARMTPDDELDEDWTRDLLDITGGRYPINFQYIRDGWGIANVFEHDKLDLDLKADPIPAEVLDSFWEDNLYRVWIFDLKAGTGRPYDELGDSQGIEWDVFRVDEHVFLSIPNAEKGSNKIYELHADQSVSDVDETYGEGSWVRVR